MLNAATLVLPQFVALLRQIAAQGDVQLDIGTEQGIFPCRVFDSDFSDSRPFSLSDRGGWDSCI